MAGIAFLRFRSFYMGLRAGATTRTSTSTCAAPARNNVRVQASTVAPDVSTSSTSTRRRPAISTLYSGGTRNAPWTLSDALGSRPPDLLRCGTDTSEPAVRDTDPANRRYCAGKNGRLMYRRAHRLRQCRGTGTSASASARSSRPARAVQRPIMGERSSRRYI
jgi:hypothetical protein